jgi:hypothetical protein
MTFSFKMPTEFSKPSTVHIGPSVILKFTLSFSKSYSFDSNYFFFLKTLKISTIGSIEEENG